MSKMLLDKFKGVLYGTLLDDTIWAPFEKTPDEICRIFVDKFLN